MKLTPMDIKNKEFKKAIRGYATDEVDEFMEEIVENYEEIFKENSRLKDTVSRISEKAKAEDLFEEVTPVDGGIADEFGFLTGTMTEKEFNETISQFDTFITRIRVGF